MTAKKRNRLFRRLRALLAGSILLAASAITGTLLWFSIAYFGIRPIVSAEYGQPVPDASTFGARAAGYVAVPQTLEKGMQRVELRLTGGGTRTGWLRVRDTVAPTADGVEKTISTRTTLAPTDLIEHLSDADKVWVSFDREPAFGTVGDYAVTVWLEDVSGNRRSVESLLHIRVTTDGVTVEAGSDAPTARSFLIDDYAVERVTGLDDETLRTPGTHSVTITIDGTDYTSTLTVVDTVPPMAVPKTVIVAPGTALEAEDFVEWVRDGSAVTATFLTEPDVTLRTFQQVTVRLTDAAGNETTLTAGLLFSDITPVTVEARTTPITAADCFLGEVPAGAQLLTSFVPNRIGMFSVTLRVNGEEQLAILRIEDTTAPTLIAQDCTYYIDHPVEVDALCRSLTDATETTVTASEIDWTREGTQTVTLTATDAAGNTAHASFALTLIRDTTPPVLYGVRDRNQYIGEAVAYYAEVFAEDAVDGLVDVTVDASKVDASRAGIYPVTYTATDRSGNTVTATCRFTFRNATVTAETLHALAQQIVASVTTPEMTRTEVLVALYDYVYGHVTYNGRSDKSDWRKEAYNGIRNGVGDCFTFYATLRALLDETDIPYMSVTRKGGATRHYWLLVNVGTGWYHLDANHNGTAHWRCFMWTNEQCARPAGFWNFEQSIYPAVATEPFDTNAVIAAERAARTE